MMMHAVSGSREEELSSVQAFVHQLGSLVEGGLHVRVQDGGLLEQTESAVFAQWCVRWSSTYFGPGYFEVLFSFFETPDVF